MSYPVFVSYSRANTKFPADEEKFTKFITDLTAEVANLEAVSGDLCFIDKSAIETGTTWPDELADSLCTAKLGLAFYSPAYFNSTWCGKEVQIFLDRAAASVPAMPSALVPVLWVPVPPPLPASVRSIQYTNAGLPRNYTEIGLRQIMYLAPDSPDYRKVIMHLGNRIHDVITDNLLKIGDPPDFARVQSAWDAPPTHDQPTRSSSIAKTYFVYLARDGWDWKPYQDQSQESVGAIAQQLAGQLNLKYEEIVCDANLVAKLDKAHEDNVPTVLLADPASISEIPIKSAMQKYDRVYFLNCGVMVPWTIAAVADEHNQQWTDIQLNICPQKTSAPPPYHEWRSISTSADLRAKTVETITGIRGRLLNKILASGSSNVLKAEDPGLAEVAAEQGYRIDVAPQLSQKAGS